MRKEIPKWGKNVPGLALVGVIIIVLLGVAVWGGRTWLEGQAPEVVLHPETKTLGASHQLVVRARDEDSGLRRFKIQLLQGELTQTVLDQNLPGSRWRGGEHKSLEQPVTLTPKAWGFKDGPAVLQVEVRDYSWRGFFQGNTQTISRPVSIDLTPLRLSFISGNEFLNQGGTGLVLYQLNKKVAKSGILVNDRFFRGYPFAEGDGNKYLVFFAMPYIFQQPPTLELVAEDEGGQTARIRLTYRLKPQRWRRDKINLSDAFLIRKMPEFQEYSPELQGISNPLEVFLRINQQEREKNAQRVREICSQSHLQPLWQGTFLRLPNSKPMAAFADYRTYVYQGREVDHQVHLGQDLASLERASVPAANHGIAVFTGPLGIYGLTVILDHGQGIFSMYSHLSEIKVANGQKVAKGEELGRTGTTGLAGGDHLHFSMLIQGDFVNPIEWWDPHWLKDQVYRQLAPPKPTVAATSGPAAVGVTPGQAKKKARRTR